jgi:excisionase family DNA binding protein
MSGTPIPQVDRRRHDRRNAGGLSGGAPLVSACRETAEHPELQILTVRLSLSKDGIFVHTSIPESISPTPPVKALAASKKETSLIDCRYLTVAEVCSILHVRKSKLYQLMRDGEIAFQRPGRERLIPESAVANYLSRRGRRESKVGRKGHARKKTS